MQITIKHLGLNLKHSSSNNKINSFKLCKIQNNKTSKIDCLLLLIDEIFTIYLEEESSCSSCRPSTKLFLQRRLPILRNSESHFSSRFLNSLFISKCKVALYSFIASSKSFHFMGNNNNFSDLPNEFPVVKPTIVVLSRVTHPSIEENTLAYKGGLLLNWTENSSLAQVVAQIH